MQLYIFSETEPKHFCRFKRNRLLTSTRNVQYCIIHTPNNDLFFSKRRGYFCRNPRLSLGYDIRVTSH